MTADGRNRVLYVTGFDIPGPQLLRPYRIRHDGTLRPLPPLNLAVMSNGILDLKIDPRDHSLYLATQNPPEQRFVKDYWYRSRIGRDGRLTLPVVKTTAPSLPAANGYVYNVGPSSVDISRSQPGGGMRRVARQQLLPVLPSVEMTDLDLTVAPPGCYAYLSHYSQQAPLTAYRIGRDGRLTLLSGEATALLSTRLVRADPSGRFLYAFDQETCRINAYRIHPNGLLTLVQSFWACPDPDFVNIEVVKLSE